MKKMKLTFCAGLLAFLGLAGCSDSPDPFEPEITAEAKLFSLEVLQTDGPYILEYGLAEKEIGVAKFSQDGPIVKLRIELSGMTPNTFKAVHIHQGTVNIPGKHWNRGSFYASCDSLSLGTFWGRPFIGDVGNVKIDSDGNGVFSLSTDLWSINSGDEKDLLGKPIIIHDLPQDFVEECNPNHDHNHLHTNPKIGGGTIELLSDVPLNLQAIEEPKDMPDFLICR
ncbi:MAG: superoxide dismutase family protein [Bacteroidota bacterium]